MVMILAPFQIFWERKHSNSNFQVRCAYQTTNIALLCKMVRVPFLCPTKTFQVLWLPNKKAGVLVWTNKAIFQGFHIKIFNWKRTHSNSNFQVRCAYQTTNIALLCKMVRVPFLCPTKTFQVLTPQQKRLVSWSGQKNIFLKTLT